MTSTLILWSAFIIFVLFLLSLDLGVFHRKDEEMTISSALAWSAVWITIGLLFSVVIYFGYEHDILGMGETYDAVARKTLNGSEAAIRYLTGYVVEKSLSMDNIFVIAMMFSLFKVPLKYQHRVLYWGILGALILRGVMIIIGAGLVARYQWVLYLFGGFLIFTGIKMIFHKEDDTPHEGRLVTWLRKVLPITNQRDAGHFLMTIDGKRYFTPLFLALVAVESADLIFAVDSIPAIFAITADPFLVFTSNVFAILGLRSLYFALAGMLHSFRFLGVSLSVILIFVGIKMLAKDYLHQVENLSIYLLCGIIVILAAGIIASLMFPEKKNESDA